MESWWSGWWGKVEDEEGVLLAGDPHTTHIGRARPVEEGCRHVEVKGGGRRQGWMGGGACLRYVCMRRGWWCWVPVKEEGWVRFGEGAAVGKTRSDGAPPSCLSARPTQVSVLTELSFYLFGVQLYQKSSGPHQLRVFLDMGGRPAFI